MASGYWVENLYVPKGHLPIIHDSLADTSALAWLLVFEDFGSSSPVNGVSKGSITTFLQNFTKYFSSKVYQFVMSSNY